MLTNRDRSILSTRLASNKNHRSYNPPSPKPTYYCRAADTRVHSIQGISLLPSLDLKRTLGRRVRLCRRKLPKSFFWMNKRGQVSFSRLSKHVACSAAQGKDPSYKVNRLPSGSTHSIEVRGQQLRPDPSQIRIPHAGKVSALEVDRITQGSTWSLRSLVHSLRSTRAKANTNLCRDGLAGQWRVSERLGYVRVRPEGFEPSTLGSEDRCAIQLRHGRLLAISRACGPRVFRLARSILACLGRF